MESDASDDELGAGARRGTASPTGAGLDSGSQRCTGVSSTSDLAWLPSDSAAWKSLTESLNHMHQHLSADKSERRSSLRSSDRPTWKSLTSNSAGWWSTKGWVVSPQRRQRKGLTAAATTAGIGISHSPSR